jgi:enoyl-CoA hydratase
MTYRNIIVENATNTARVTLDRPEHMNPLDRDTIGELMACFRELEWDDAMRIVRITGAGRAFSAGGDLQSYLDLYRKPDEYRKCLDDFFDLFDLMERSAMVFIAEVNGFCVAGGLELMLACDLAVASEDARIGDGHLNFGQLPGAGGSQRLPRAIGATRAKQLIYTGRLINGREAERIGLVAEAVPSDALAATVDALVETMLEKSPLGLARAKLLVNEGMRCDLAAALELEMDLVHDYATTSEDVIEGLVAFKDKRKPNFTGR